GNERRTSPERLRQVDGLRDSNWSQEFVSDNPKWDH
ncbi:hypothetical protein NPIL_452451, partial [Nephila pilipes]